jgi:metal-sulfur cluster biosynthetic enzyme
MTMAARSGPATCAGPDEAAVYAALDRVIDPELDESLLKLEFIDGVHIEGDCVTVGLRLPTFWCAPNFAYMMARDTRDRLLEVAGVHRARITLKDHFASDEITAGVTEGRPFEEVFPGDAEGNLDGLRQLFRRKAFTTRQERFVRLLLDAGLSGEEVVGLRRGDIDFIDTGDDLLLEIGATRRLLPGGAELAHVYLARRQELGLDCGASAPLVTDSRGSPVPAADLVDSLRGARKQRVSMEFNTSLCRGLLTTRYGASGPERPTNHPASTRT